MGQWWYYDFINQSQALDKCLVKGLLPYEIHYIKDVVSTKISQFRYKGELPKGLTSDIIEKALMFMNQLCFYKSKNFGWVLCRYIYGSQFNLYLRPDYVNLMALNGAPLEYNIPYKDIILVKDNSMDIIPFICINEYLMKVQSIDSSVFKMLNVATLPIVLVGNKKMGNSLKQTAKALGSKDAFIFGDDSLTDTVKGFDIDLKVTPEDIYDLKLKYRNEMLSALGIYSAERKTERLIVNEVRSQNDYTDFVYQDGKMQRQAFVDALNKTGDFKIELVETYDVNSKEDAELEGYKQQQIEGAKEDKKDE